MIRFENGSVLVTNDPVITYDHITEGHNERTKKPNDGRRIRTASLPQTILETLLMLTLFALCAWMGFHD